MFKQIAAVGVGLVVWSVACFLSTTVLIEFHAVPDSSDSSIREPGSLLALLVCAVLSAMAAGYASAAVHPSSLQPVLIPGWTLVVLGAIVQSQSFERTPLWYHVAFLSLLLPMCLAGARLHHAARVSTPQRPSRPNTAARHRSLPD